MQRWQLGPDVIVETADPLLADALDTVFSALQIRESSCRHPLTLAAHNGHLTVHAEPVARLPEPNQLAPSLESLLTHYIAECTRTERGLHAGGIALRGHTILLPGERGSGKSTATRHLARLGVYLGDDMVFVNEKDLTVRGFPKAVTLKEGSFPLFEAGPTYDDPIRGAIRYVLPQPFSVLAPPPAVIVFPQYEAGSEAEVRRLDPPVAALALVQQSFGRDGRRLETAARLAQLPCYVIRYGRLEDLEREVERLA